MVAAYEYLVSVNMALSDQEVETEIAVEDSETSAEDIEDPVNVNFDELNEIRSKIWKPFGAYVEQIIASVIVKEPDAKGQPNPLFNPSIMDTLKKHWLPTLPLWTNILRGKSQQMAPTLIYQQQVTSVST